MTADDQAEIDRKQQAFTDAIGPAYADVSFATYRIYDDRQRTAVGLLEEYSSSFAKNLEDMRGLVLYGPSRTGKDHLAISLCRDLLNRYGHCRLSGRGFFVKHTNCRRMFARFKSECWNGKRSELEFIGEHAWAAAQVFSDPFSSKGTLAEYESNLLYDIWEMRFKRGLPSILTCNVPAITEVKKRLEDRNFNRLGNIRQAIDCSWQPWNGSASFPLQAGWVERRHNPEERIADGC